MNAHGVFLGALGQPGDVPHGTELRDLERNNLGFHQELGRRSAHSCWARGGEKGKRRERKVRQHQQARGLWDGS